jgi:hypothetical protein
LDRFAALRNIELRSTTATLDLANHGDTRIDGLTVAAPVGYTLADSRRRLQRRKDGHIIVGELGPRGARRFDIVVDDQAAPSP